MTKIQINRLNSKTGETESQCKLFLDMQDSHNLKMS